MDITKLICTFLISVIFSYILTTFYLKKKNKSFSFIREELLNKNKARTPVGGFCFILSSILSLLLVDYKVFFDKKVLLILIPSLIFFILGFIDDYKKKKSYKGLSALLRAVVEIVVSFIFLYYLPIENYGFNLPNNGFIYLGSLTILLIPLIIFGATNALNLTDGMDGLLSFLFSLAFLPVLLKSLLLNEYSLSLLFISLYGSLFSFIRFNIHPAKIFMGDQGSLFLGGFFAFASFVLNVEYLLPISGLVFVIETMSVIIQVLSFNLFHKRVFLMSPIHHHYEIKGVKEWKVVYVFMLIQMILMMISLMLIL